MQNIIHRILGGSAYNKGILAADESSPTIKKRFDSVGVDSTESTRHSYRHNLFSTDKLEDYIGGVILFDETIRNEDTISPLKEKDICLGIKVDKGAKPYDMDGLLTEGLDGLSDRLKEYSKLGAEFAKWRAVLNVHDTDACIIANAWTLARYAKICQDEGIVPIVEPEVLMSGGHRIIDSLWFTEKVLHHVFDAMYYENVELEAMILKPNMILNGYKSNIPLPQFSDSAKTLPDSEIVAHYTIHGFRRYVPAAVPMIAFLSGGQPDGKAVENLNQMNFSSLTPWPLSFSFGRELQNSSLALWGNGELGLSREALLRRAVQCSMAAEGNLNEYE
jgi:fructose-bisphosphate aldolase class I|tara:strand:+ start:1043 stop:2041 length:999 start_codon:yes stop_codon:yes gene_type:complete